MRMALDPNPASITAFVGMFSVIVAATWWLLSDDPVWAYEKPTYAGKTVQRLVAALPPIGDFTHDFNVNDMNPFLPDAERQQERVARQIKKTAKPIPTSTPPSQVSDVVIPTLHLPAAAPRRKNAPECFGIIGSSNGMTILTRMPGSQETHQLEQGQTIAETGNPARSWTFIGLDSANMARFRDPMGEEQMFRVGPSITTKAADSAASTPPKAKTPVKDPASPQNKPATPATPGGPPRPNGTWSRPAPPSGQMPGDPRERQGWSPRPAERPVDESGQPVPAPPFQPQR